MTYWVVAASILSLLVTGEAGEIGATQLEGEVRRLVAQLDAPVLHEREAAERKLLELGPQVLGFLPDPEELPSEEGRLRLARIRQQLELQLARSTAEPSTVEIVGQLSVWEALQQLEIQTGNAIEWENAQAERLAKGPAASGTGLPKFFWPAMDHLANAAGLEVAPSDHSAAVAVRVASSPTGPVAGEVAYAGPLRCRILSCTLREDIDAGKRELLVRLQLLWEPRLRPIVFYWLGSQFRGYDSRGSELRAASGEGTREVPVLARSCGTSILGRLEMPGEPPLQKIDRLEGRLVAVIAGEAIPVRFPLGKLCPQVRRLGDATVILQNVNTAGNQTLVSLRAIYTKAFTAFESHRAWFYEYRPWIARPGGETVRPVAIEPQFQREQDVAVLFRFPSFALDQGGEIVWPIPPAIIREEFTLRWENIPVSPAAGPSR